MMPIILRYGIAGFLAIISLTCWATIFLRIGGYGPAVELSNWGAFWCSPGAVLGGFFAFMMFPWET
jgi:hypothetical protein